jgi:5-formyltetrahydrofolate cyclo-ligase
MDKALLRRQLRERLQVLTADQKEQKSYRACQGLVSFRPFQQASIVMMFLSMPDEIDTAVAIHVAWQEGKTVVVPRVDWEHRTMTPVAIDSLDTNIGIEGRDLRNPLSGEVVDVGRIDLVVTPGLGFDRQGHRIGRGAGFYDRFFGDLKLRALRCGFCFSEQVVESVPVVESDRPVDWLVTDEQVLCVQDRKGI